MKNYNKISITEDSRIELHDKLGLTGAEVSINTLLVQMFLLFIRIRITKKYMRY